jgi:phosphoenolpyruvate carboxylase
LDILEFARMGSRPTRRTGANTLADLRAIPFALAQSQTRFNLTAWYGVGQMLQRVLVESPAHFKKLSQIPPIKFVLTNVEMALKSASLEWMTAYSKLEPDAHLRHHIMDQIGAEYELTTQMLDRVFGAPFDTRRPRLERTIFKRKNMLDVLHRFQIQSLSEWRSARFHHREDEEAWLFIGLMTMNAISNGLRGTG